MALKVAEVLIRWRQEGQQQVVTANKQMGQSFTDLGNKAKAAGAVLTAGLTAPLLLIGKQAVDAASDLNEATSAVTTVFGQASDQVVNFTRTAASQLGQSRQAALSAASALGALFKGVGLSEQQMADFSTSLLQASADLGSFFNVDPGDALQKLRSGLVGEAEGLRQFGILLSADAVEAKGLALGLGDVNGELSEGAKVQARYALIMEQIGSASGDFSRTSDGLANSQRILAARMQDVRAEIGGFLLPYALRLSGVVSTLIDRFLSLDERSKGLAVGIGAVAAAAGPALLILGQILPIVAKIGPAIALITGPVGLVIGAVVGLGIAFKENWFGIRDLVTNVTDRVGNAMDRMIQFFQHAKERGLSPFRLALRTLIVVLGEQIGDDTPIVRALRGILRNGEQLIEWVTTDLIPNLRNIGTVLRGGEFSQAATIAQRIVDDLKTGWNRTFGAFLDELKDTGQRIFDSLLESIKDVDWNQLGDQAGALIQSGLSVLSGAGSWIVNTIKGAGEGVRAGGQTMDIADEIGAWLSERFRAVDWEKLGNDLLDGAIRAATLFLDFQKWRLDRVVEIGAFLIERFRAVDWPQVGAALVEQGQKIASPLIERMKTIAADAAQALVDAFKTVNWDQVGTTIMEGLQASLSAIASLDRWTAEQLAGVDWSGLKNELYNKAVAFSAGIEEGARRGILAIADFDRWLLDQFDKIDWDTPKRFVMERGQAISDGLLGGMQQKNDEIINWFNLMGERLSGSMEDAKSWLLEKGKEVMQGLLDGILAIFANISQFFNNIGGSIVGALPKEWGSTLYDKGVELITGMWSGMIDTWESVEKWLAERDVAGQDRAKGGQQPGMDPNEPAGSGRAFGGMLNRRFTKVGEYGPELLIDRQLVMPHGAAQSRIQAMGGMAMGGTGSWREWLLSQDNRTRQAVRAMRSAGQLNRTVRDQLMAGLTPSSFDSAMEFGSRGWVSPERRAFNRRMRAEGYSRDEIDAMWADSPEGRAYGRKRREATRDARNREQEFRGGWSPETGPYRNERERQRKLRQADREAERARDFGSSSTSRGGNLRADRSQRSHSSGEMGGTHFHFAGPVRFEITKPDIAAEVRRQVSSYNR